MGDVPGLSGHLSDEVESKNTHLVVGAGVVAGTHWVTVRSRDWRLIGSL